MTAYSECHMEWALKYSGMAYDSLQCHMEWALKYSGVTCDKSSLFVL